MHLYSSQAQILEALGAIVERVRPVSISHKDHFVNIARRKAASAEAPYKKAMPLNSGNELKNEFSSFNLDLNSDKLVHSSEDTGSAVSCEFENQYNCLSESHLELKENPESLLHEEDKCKGGFFADQFENLANFRAHYYGTGPEIWAQTGGKLDAFVAAAGTGGTIAGVSRFLKVKFVDVFLSGFHLAKKMKAIIYNLEFFIEI